MNKKKTSPERKTATHFLSNKMLEDVIFGSQEGLLAQIVQCVQITH